MAEITPSKEEFYAALEARHGKERQARFSQARVAICGLGGLGSNLAIALARAGVGHLHLIDFDVVDLTNLNRQQYFVSQLGRPKTEALAETLASIAPYCELTCDTVKLTPELVPALLKDDHILCEAFDRPEAKAMLVNTALSLFPDKPLVAASGMAGLESANLIRTRRVAKNFYLCGDGTSDIKDGLGLVAARVQVCAAHQATMVLRLLDGQTEP